MGRWLLTTPMSNHSLRWSLALLVEAIFLSLAGCRSCDLVEAELRTREKELREAKDELHRSELFNEALERELHGIRAGTHSFASPELASQTYTLKEIVLGRQTGGYDDEGRRGDEALQVVLEPRDPDGHAIKAPGSLHVDVLQINAEGLKMPLSSWDLTPDQLRRTWRSGLFATGYYVLLPWKVRPTTSKLRVVARFTLADQRVFEADKDVTIRLPPEPHRPTGPLLLHEEIIPGPVLPNPEPVLPAPRKFEATPADKEATRAIEGQREPYQSASWKREIPAVQPEGVRILPPVRVR
jgi:hypothetical protein